MKKSFDNLSSNEKKFLKSILGEGKKTDTEIANETGLSVSTVNRIRHDFEDKDIIEDYISVIDLEGVSIELYSLIELNNRRERSLEDIKTKNVIFSGKTDEAKQNYVILMGHRNYEDYQKTITKLRKSLTDKDKIESLKLIPAPDAENFVLRGRSSI